MGRFLMCRMAKISKNQSHLYAVKKRMLKAFPAGEGGRRQAVG